MKTDEKKLPNESVANKKRAYIKPKIESEKLNSYGAICDGTTIGGKKASTSGPSFCNASKKLS